MKPELERVRNDVETIQKALGLAPTLGREWIEWMKRDRWFSLWWCLPGCILIAAALLPLDDDPLKYKFMGLVPNQWAGIMAAIPLLGVAIGHTRKVTRQNGRPDGLVREYRRMYGLSTQGWWFGGAFGLQLLFYFAWGRHYHIVFHAFWAGLFILMGSTCLVAALVARAWILLGYALPFLAYGLCLPLAEGHHQVNGVLFGLMFVGIALSFSFIQVCQIRQAERSTAGC